LLGRVATARGRFSLCCGAGDGVIRFRCDPGTRLPMASCHTSVDQPLATGLPATR